MAFGPYVPQLYDNRQSTADIARTMLEASRQRFIARQQQAQMLQQGITDVGSAIARIPQQKLEEAKAKRQEELANAQAAQMQRQQADQEATDKALGGLDPNPTDEQVKAIAAQLPGHLRLDFMKHAQEYQALAQKHREQQQELFARGAAGVLTAMKGSPEAGAVALQGLLAHSKQMGYDTSKYEELLQDPSKAEPLLLGIMSSSPVVAKEWYEQHKPEKLAPGEQLLDPITHQPLATVPPKAPTITPGSFEDFAKREYGENPTPQQLLQARTKWAAAGKEPESDNAPSLTPAAIESAARRYLTDGSLPPMGMGKQGAKVRQTILNRAAEIDPQANAAVSKAVFGADADSFKKLQGQVNAVSAFENTAKANGQLLRDTLKNLPDTGTSILNKPLRSLSGKFGNTDLTKFETLRQSVANEYARLISNPGLNGVMSDSARKEGEVLLNPNATVGQIIAALDTLQAEAGNRHKAYSAQLDEIRGRMGGAGGGKGAPKADEKDPLGIR